MSKKGGEAALKRAREKTRLEKQDAKRQRRLARTAENDAAPVDTDALLEEFAHFSALHEANKISAARFNEERQRILEALGIESQAE
jgi:hypothetical protein